VARERSGGEPREKNTRKIERKNIDKKTETRTIKFFFSAVPTLKVCTVISDRSAVAAHGGRPQPSSGHRAGYPGACQQKWAVASAL